MKVEKVINNNLVRSVRDGREILVMGKGIGFQTRPGDSIDQDLVERIYTVEDNDNPGRLEKLLAGIPYTYLQVTNEIVNYARNSLGKKLSDNIYLTLTDHICFALERAKGSVELQNALLWEIKRFYNHEYLIGKEALEIIQRRLNVKLPEAEAGFIALHIVNAELDSPGIQKTMEITRIIQNILQIVRYQYCVEIDENSIHYERFVTHLKYFVNRIQHGVQITGDELGFTDVIRQKYPDEYKCARKIQDYIYKEMNVALTDDELIYLAIHIRRITLSE